MNTLTFFLEVDTLKLDKGYWVFTFSIITLAFIRVIAIPFLQQLKTRNNPKTLTQNNVGEEFYTEGLMQDKILLRRNSTRGIGTYSTGSLFWYTSCNVPQEICLKGTRFFVDEDFDGNLIFCKISWDSGVKKIVRSLPACA